MVRRPIALVRKGNETRHLSSHQQRAAMNDTGVASERGHQCMLATAWRGAGGEEEESNDWRVRAAWAWVIAVGRASVRAYGCGCGGNGTVPWCAFSCGGLHSVRVCSVVIRRCAVFARALPPTLSTAVVRAAHVIGRARPAAAASNGDRGGPRRNARRGVSGLSEDALSRRGPFADAEAAKAAASHKVVTGLPFRGCSCWARRWPSVSNEWECSASSALRAFSNSEESAGPAGLDQPMAL